MYVDESTIRQGERTYTRYLLRESYREGKKVRHRTIANLSQCSTEEIAAIRLALRHKKDLTELRGQTTPVSLTQGLSVGAVWLLYEVARQQGISDALGSSREGRLALWQVIARVIDQGSRLSAVRLAGSHAACDVCGLERFDEDDLYANLDWLAEHQVDIEDRLFLKRADKQSVYLYDVTSSYLEGTENELSAFGYNRDGKKGKRQIVIGLLCDASGTPLSIEVFAGNTRDTRTLANQVKKAAMRFGAQDVTFVGDRGMIKSEQIKDLGAYGFHYITAITKPQIETLLKSGLIQMDLFDQELAEVVDDHIRYVLRRNPVRAMEMRQSREDKLTSLHKKIAERNDYLKRHPRAKVDTALQKLTTWRNRMRLSGSAVLTAEGRHIMVSVDDDALTDEAKLDGCYVLKSDLSLEAATKETIHNRYKDLALVESAFRCSKTVHLELRPIHVRLATRTRGHVFVVMLAYQLIQELAVRWRDLEVTVKEGINELSSLCAQQVSLNGSLSNQIPHPRGSIKKLLDAARVRMPEALPSKGIVVSTKKKLLSRRKPH
jgi:transposase